MNKKLLYLFLVVFISACSVQRPLQTERVSMGIDSKVKEELKELPAPSEQIVAAVYRFKDQTGQYKSSDRIASWSTAVTQGATSILIKAMEDSGWFIPIEREGLSNLLNERNIIQQIRAQNSGSQQVSPLPPLLYAGVMLEGGIIGYDTNIITGGVGARYFGTGANEQFRKDQITIYLRAVSTQSGRVLKTVHTTKSIISQQLESGVFRFIDSNRLLEAEAGYSYNEPPVLAVTEAIDEAVRLLILEGIDENIWTAANETEYEQYLANHVEINRAKDINYFGMEVQSDRSKRLRLGLSYMYSEHIGNYSDVVGYSGVQLSFEKPFRNNLSANLALFRSGIGAKNVFEDALTGADLSIDLLISNAQIPIAPYIGFGGSVLAYDTVPEFARYRFYPAALMKAGIVYNIAPEVDLRLGVQYRYMLNDGLDGYSGGNIMDQYWNLNGGLVFKNLF